MGDTCFTDSGRAFCPGIIVQIPANRRGPKYYRVKLSHDASGGDDDDNQEIVAQQGSVFHPDDEVPAMSKNDSSNKRYCHGGPVMQKTILNNVHKTIGSVEITVHGLVFLMGSLDRKLPLIDKNKTRGSLQLDLLHIIDEGAPAVDPNIQPKSSSRSTASTNSIQSTKSGKMPRLHNHSLLTLCP